MVDLIWTGIYLFGQLMGLIGFVGLVIWLGEK